MVEIMGIYIYIYPECELKRSNPDLSQYEKTETVIHLNLDFTSLSLRYLECVSQHIYSQ